MPRTNLGAVLDGLLELCEEPLGDEIRSLQRRLRTGDLRVVLAGEAKRGKSTLVNALLGRAVMPTGVTPVTALPTTVGHGAPERVEVEFVKGPAMSGPISGLDRYVTQRHNPTNRLGVAEIRVFLPVGLPHPRMVLIDSPGVGSAFIDNTSQAAQAQESMDVALFILTADAPMSASEMQLLTRLAELSVEVLVVLNKADLLHGDDEEQVRAYVAGFAAEVLGEEPEVYTCSGRAGLAARLAGDPTGWRASGLEGLEHALVDRAEHARTSTVETSIAAAVQRLAARQLDQLTVKAAAIRRVRDNRLDDLAAFAGTLDSIRLAADDAGDLVAQQTIRYRRLIEEDARRKATALGSHVRKELSVFIETASRSAPEDLEIEARSLVASLVQAGVEQWRSDWYQQLSATLAEHTRRQEELLQQSFVSVAAATERLLGVRLTATVPILQHHTLPPLAYDFSAELGWNQAASSTLRHRMFGARWRTARYLQEEAARLVDKHIGRAQADFRLQLEETGRQMRSSLGRALDELVAGLSLAERSAHSVALQSRDELEPTLRELAAKSAQLHELLTG